MMRIIFTDQDLARTTVASGPSPAIELFASLRLIQSSAPPPPWFASWRDRIRTALGPDRRILTELVPARGYAVAILEPNPTARTVADTVDTFAATPADLIHEEVAGLARYHRPLSRHGQLVADGHRGAVAAVGAAIHGYHATAIAPAWDTVRRAVDLDLARRARFMLHGGVTELLATLGPRFRWRFPVLEMWTRTTNSDVPLTGRGLLLQPSLLAHAEPILWNFEDPDLRPTLVYPAPASLDTGGRPVGALGDLLGRTRAAVLARIAGAGGCTTGELARGLDISPAAVSQHTTVLRRAGLIGTTRFGKAVLHTATPQGTTLLDHD